MVNKQNLVVQSLWVGDRLSRMEYYSIKSFLVLGYTFHLYTYNKVKNVPKGTIIKNAAEIMPKKEVFYLQTTSLPFSDIWRYKLLYEKGGYWVDVDMIAIKRFNFKEPFIFSSERTIQGNARFASYLPYVPNIGVLKAPPKSEFYKEAYEKSMLYNKTHDNDDKLKYMRMLRELIKKYNYQKYVKMPEVFCNLDWWHAKEAFMPLKKYPNKYDVKAPTIASMFNGPYTVHFWRDRVTKKYGLSLDEIYDPNSLWELMISYVDMYDKKKSKKKSIKKSKKKIMVI